MRKLILFPLATVLLTGCLVTSIDPIYTPNDIVFEPALVATWSDSSAKDPTTWRFEKSSDNSYKLQISDQRWDYSFDAHLAKLGTNLFLDVCLSDEALKELDDGYQLYGGFLVPGHGIFKVCSIGPDSIRISMLNGQWADKLLKNDPAALRHQRASDKRIVVTAATKQLQSFLLKYGADDEAFPKGGEMTRVKPSESKQPAK